MNKRTIWITRTACFLALLMGVQLASQGLGNQFVTGSLVNMMLAVSVMIGGFASGTVVALVSPFLAMALPTASPPLPLVPFIALGNFTLVALWYIIVYKIIKNNLHLAHIVATIVGAIGKFAVLYVGIVLFAAPHILGLPVGAPVYFMFSWPQLVTALIGGAIACLILPTLRKALGFRFET